MTGNRHRVENFGCRLNALDGDYIEAALAATKSDRPLRVVNSCAVTTQAVRQAKQSVRRVARENPKAAIFVTGCAAQTTPAQFAAMPEVTRVLGNEEKFNPASYAPNGAREQVGDIMQAGQIPSRPPAPNMPDQNRARAFVQVQTGCDHRCTFCIIPFGRGNARSMPIKDVVRDCTALVERGHKEIVLTGVDLTSWGADIGEAGAGVLVRAILEQVPQLPALRLSSVDAAELDADLQDMVAHEERIMPHLHLSLQAGDNMILKRMKRRHTREQAVAFCHAIKRKRPDIVFGADMIAGFPTETDAMFENSVRLVAECELVWLHVFPFSPRPNTPAAKMPQVKGTVIKQRAAALREAGAKIRHTWLDAQIGKTLDALIESPTRARTAHFAQIILPDDGQAQTGQLARIRISGHDGQMLQGVRA